ncbi:hypothetical protein LINPERHAP2_LOCUS24593 [Linum perenne]
MMKKEREDELELFKELHKREKDRASSLLQPISSDEFDANHSFYRFPSTKKDGSHPNYDFFSAASNGKSDYDWLKTPPATPLFPSLEMEATGPPSLLLQREITIVQPLSRLSGSSTAMKNKNISDRTTSSSTTPDRGVAAKSPSTSTSTSRPNIPTGASFRHSAQSQRTSPPILNLNTNNTAAAAVKNNIVTSSTAAVATEPTPEEPQGKPTSSLHHQIPAASPTIGIHSLRDPTPATTSTCTSSRNGIGKSTKTLPQQQSRRSSSSTRPAGLTTSHHDVLDHPPPPPMRLVDRASSASRVRPPGNGISIGTHQNQTKASTSSNSVTTTKPRRHSVTRSSIITSNTTPPTATRQSTTKTTTSPSSSYSNRQKFHTSTTKTNNSTSGTSTSTNSSSKQIFGSKMVDKVISARKAASGSDQQSKPAAPNSPGLGFGRISAPRNMVLNQRGT